jgi:outer membrane protein OmpA-like peptidoglycan-associated protein
MVMHYDPITVFFDFEKANLTGRAADAVADFVAREHHVPHHAVVIGYCDTAEHHRHDLALRRAETVKDELVRRGMDAGSIEVKASDDLLVKTGDHTREPQNRRVVISH